MSSLSVTSLYYNKELVGFRFKRSSFDTGAPFEVDVDLDLLPYLARKLDGHCDLQMCGIDKLYECSDGYMRTRDEKDVVSLDTKIDVDRFINIYIDKNYTDYDDSSIMRWKVLICQCLLKSIGINTGYLEQVCLNPNLRSAWGLCEKTDIPKRFNLAFSERLLQASEKGVYTVILHELLHTCKDCFKHTGQWKFYANKVSNRLGYNITRTSSSKDLGVDFSSIPEGMFACVCNGCGSLVTRKTLKGIISLEKNYYCGCGGSFERVV